MRHKKNKSFFIDQPPKKIYEAIKTEEDAFKNTSWHKYSNSAGLKKQSY